MLRFAKNLIHLFFSFLACLYYGFPGRKMTVIGITGTDGKTTTSHLIYHILINAKKKASLVSTIAAYINGKSYDTGFHVTTPSSWQLQKFMALAVKGKSEYFVLETTSHGLDQNRVYGTSIDMGIITNISHEHIDYHKTFNHYKKSKAKILRGVKYSILNNEDNNFEFLTKVAGGKIITFGLSGKADFTQENLRLKPRIIGRFNLLNSLAAAAAASTLGLDEKDIKKAIENFNGIPGRMEEFPTDKNFRIFVDFAHKPNAMENVLETTRKITKNKLIVVFGCAGLRDSLKRPMMGEIAGNLADYAIFTAEDPRTEDVRNIIDQIAKGCLKTKMKEADKNKDAAPFLNTKGKYFWRIPDRQEAINFAIRKIAKENDFILICGKGHEKSMCYGKIEYPWDEKKAIFKALYGTVKNSS